MIYGFLVALCGSIAGMYVVRWIDSQRMVKQKAEDERSNKDDDRSS